VESLGRDDLLGRGSTEATASDNPEPVGVDGPVPSAGVHI
jgi:hypothetical protein